MWGCSGSDWSLWAICQLEPNRPRNPSKFAFGSRGTHSGPLNSWPRYALCFTLWTLTPEMYDTHTRTDENMSTHMLGESVDFQKVRNAHTQTHSMLIVPSISQFLVTFEPVMSCDRFILKPGQLDRSNCYFNIPTKWMEMWIYLTNYKFKIVCKACAWKSCGSGLHFFCPHLSKLFCFCFFQNETV